MTNDCEPAACELLTDAKASWQCRSGSSPEQADMLPTKSECLALHLPEVPVTCPWATGTMHSGENDIMECMDGFRCNVTNDGYDCCSITHYGRGRCPMNQPVMCSDLASGDTEYLCREKVDKCPSKARRRCSSLLIGKPVYDWPVVPVVPTLPPPAEYNAIDDAGNQIAEFMTSVLGPAWGMWLAFIFIVLGLAGTLFGCLYYAKYAPNYITDKPMIEVTAEADKLGGFGFVKKPDTVWEEDTRAPLHVIYVGELPLKRPLGLEMQETTVIKVHPNGKKWGWKTGDKIVEMAGTPVRTFEEIWNQIQIERDRLPCRFV